MENFREFTCGPDPFGRTWQVYFKWLQTAISIRHSDSVDVKFVVSDGEESGFKVISMPHLTLRDLASDMGVKMTDAWCARLAKQHLEHLILSGEDLEKDLITPSPRAPSILCADCKKLGVGTGPEPPRRRLVRVPPKRRFHAGRTFHKTNTSGPIGCVRDCFRPVGRSSARRPAA